MHNYYVCWRHKSCAISLPHIVFCFIARTVQVQEYKLLNDPKFLLYQFQAKYARRISGIAILGFLYAFD